MHVVATAGSYTFYSTIIQSKSRKAPRLTRSRTMKKMTTTPRRKSYNLQREKIVTKQLREELHGIELYFKHASIQAVQKHKNAVQTA